MVSVGTTASQTAVAVTADTGPSLTPSVAAFAGTLTTTSSPSSGVIPNVYSAPLPENVPFAPPVTVTSSVTNPVTSSLNVNVAVSRSLPLILSGRPVMVSVGTTASQTAVAVTADTGPSLTPSVAAFAGTLTTTSSPSSGVIPNVYSAPLPENVPFAPPVTVTSSVTNPVTSSLNVNVAVSRSLPLILSGRPVMVSVGTTASQTAVAVTADTGPSLTPSVAASAGTLTSTSAVPDGVISNVYVRAFVAVNVPFAPPVTVTSSVTNPVTSSLNVNVAVSRSLVLILLGRPVTARRGTTVSQNAVAVTVVLGKGKLLYTNEPLATKIPTLELPAGVTTSV